VPEVQATLVHLVRCDPVLFGLDAPRLTLEEIRLIGEAWLPSSESGVWRALKRLGITYKRGKSYLHSPDEDYFEKLHAIRSHFEAVQADPQRARLVFVDEMSYARSPTVGYGFEAVGSPQPLARQGYQTNTLTRVMGALDPLDGRVLFRQRLRFGVAAQVGFYRQLREVYPDPERIYVVLDNWPIHFHPDLLVALEPQVSPFPRRYPPRWSTEPSEAARRKWGRLHLPIQLLPLPTYAPWTNPIEKLWRWVRQRVLHLHRLAEDLGGVRERVRRCLAALAEGSTEVLRYVGLSVPEKLYHYL
jgi:transposase